jgi:hypothetical protein
MSFFSKEAWKLSFRKNWQTLLNCKEDFGSVHIWWIACLGDIQSVTAIKMDIELIDVYIIDDKPYYYFNFILYLKK